MQRQTTEALGQLEGFIGRSQLSVMIAGCRGEEGEFFRDKLGEMGERCAKMHVTAEQDGSGDQAICWLHYFTAGCDWWILERDCDPDGEGQVQAFGYADLGFGPGCAELGYISITEILANGGELDLHFEPKPLELIKRGRS
jgi:hypothetical protein